MNDLKKQYGPWAVIAGGSEGIGLCFARQLASAGLNLILLARRMEALETAKQDIENEFPVEVCIHSLDLTAIDLEQQLKSLAGDREIGLMIYNAGAQHGAELFVDDTLTKAQQLIQLNCHGPSVFCHTFGKAMRDRGRGGIILLSSMSGLAGSAYVAAYSASKSFVMTLAEGLHTELQPLGVNVLCLVAGATDTPSMARSGIDFGADEQGGMNAMAPEDVAREGLDNLVKGPIHVAGEQNRAVAEMLFADRGQATEMLSFGAASMYGKPFPISSED